MIQSTEQLPEPLHRFAGVAVSLATTLAEVDSRTGDYRARRAVGRVLPNTLEALRIELTYHSNALEGNTLTLRETQLVIEGKSPAGEKPLREIYEARNHDRALRLIEKWAADSPNDALGEQHLLEIHAQVMADIAPQAAGRFRAERVRIAGTGFIPPGAQKFPVLIPTLIDLANAPGVHPVLQAAELHYNLAATHPFIDGNGRTARLMMNHHLLRHDFPMALIEVNQRGNYLAALDEANHGRLQPFATIIAQGVLRYVERALME